MYCPRCAAHLAATATRCERCDLDVQGVAQLLHATDQSIAHRSSAEQVQHWKQQRHGWGLLLVLCSLLVGCLIPISIGLLGGSAALGSVVTGLSGLAGVLFVIGVMLILAAEGTILTTDQIEDDAAPVQQAAQTGATVRLLTEPTATPGTHHDQATSQPVRR